MKLQNWLIPLAIAITLPMACERAGDLPRSRASGALSKDEAGLFSKLPGGATVVFGGNLYQAQKWMQNSALGRISKAMSTPEMAAYNECMAGRDFRAVGAGEIAAGSLRMSMYLHGIPLDGIKECATKSGVPVEMDPDGKFGVVLLTAAPGQPAVRSPYLAVDGGVYSRLVFPLAGFASGNPEPVTLGRAELEKDVAGLAQSNLANDARMTGWLAKVDRSKPFYFVGSGAGTPIADEVGLAYGAFDIRDGLSMEITVAVLKSATRDQVLSGWKQMRGSLDQLPPAMSAIKEVIKSIQLGQAGDNIRAIVKVSEAQLDAIAGQLGGMIPGLP